jgi:hypothetical protein
MPSSKLEELFWLDSDCQFMGDKFLRRSETLQPKFFGRKHARQPYKVMAQHILYCLILFTEQLAAGPKTPTTGD